MLGGSAAIAGARVRMLEHAHVVVVALRGGATAVRCTCSSFGDAGRCAHAWAAVLAMDERRLPTAAHDGGAAPERRVAGAVRDDMAAAGRDERFVELRGVDGELARGAEDLADAVVHALGSHAHRDRER